jgi:hypothetical protein
VFEQTLERAREIGLEAELLPVWYDVDDGATLERLRRELLGASGASSAGYDARHTRTYLESLQPAQSLQHAPRPACTTSSAC